ncbi:hypothetical protein AVEN_195057-1 [Araneus ventricosus]|uniref:Uncharacterized protein n=1 Tax=Araneus ventricosus TaxID=182803 RepID=A0A4Y2H841_ARAVE|nr:hypothetical protein AVEN_195057-1 [Araneus ventricosus]
MPRLEPDIPSRLLSSSFQVVSRFDWHKLAPDRSHPTVVGRVQLRAQHWYIILERHLPSAKPTREHKLSKFSTGQTHVTPPDPTSTSASSL